MALEKIAKIPSLVRKAGQSASKAQPFYSNVDQAIANITQGTGTGAQMLAELLKTKGVAKELKDRPAIKKTLEANKDAKVTKVDLERLAAENPPPQIDETALGGKQNYSDAEIEREYRRIYGNPYTSDGERIGIEEMRDAVISSTAGVDSSFVPKYAKYTIPGGENYREILLKLPSRRPSLKNMSRDEYNKAIQKADLKGLEDYRTSHFEEPNVLAHARVADRVGPNGEKILHVEEIQSDWHQAARDARKKKIKFLMEEKGVDEATARTMVPEDYGYKKEGIDLQIEKSNKKLAELEARHRDLYRQLVNLPDSEKEKFAKLEAERNEIGEQIKGVKDEKNLLDDWRVNSVPDAPLKQSWHELVMKRLLDDAARNGYDKVVITPGSKQAERYKLSSHIDNMRVSPEYKGLRQISWRPRQSGAEQALKFDSEGTVTDSMLMGLRGKNISDVFGKELALKIMNAEPYQQFEGLDLDVGGKGMIGFYDKILPSYLNDYGKRYGAQVGTYNLPDPNVHHIPTMADIQRGGMEMFGRADLTPEETLQVENAFRAQRSAETAIPLHSFDITPQMREEITTKGVPLYQAAPPVAIGAGAMQEEQPAEYAGGGIIKKAGQIIGKAAQSSGMARPVTATKDLTTLQDFHTSLGDRIRERVAERQNLIESMPFKYDKGQRVFTEDSARKNWLPYEILDRTLFGNRPMRADHPVLGPGMGAVIKDPETGKAMRTPYEAGYRVRHETPEGWQEYVLPETAIKGDVEMAGGGAVRKALKAVLPKGQQDILSVAESAANLERFLSKSQTSKPVFHVAKTDVKQFSPQHRTELSSMGHHFGTSDQANFRSGQYDFNSQSPNIGKYHLSIQNPLEVSHMASFAPDHLADTMMELNLLKPEKYDALVGKHDYNPLKIGDDLVKILKKNGYDGLKYPNEREGEGFSYVPFDATQIKSAIGNRGTYDPAEADINKAGGGIIKKAAKALLPKGQQAILPAAESAANLDKFLAESAVKDRMYHATSRGGFSTFDRNKTTEWRQPSMDTVGSWFSDNPSEVGGAGMYASGQGASIYPVHLSIKNPKVYNTFNDFLRDMHAAAGREMPKSAPGLGSTEELRQKLKAEGYDGIAFNQTANESLMQDIQEMQDAVKRARMEELSMKRHEREPYTAKRERLEQTLNAMGKELRDYGSSTEFDQQRVFVPLEPTQIKSAIGNRGTYDITDPDITKAKGGRVTNDAMWMAVQNKQLRKKHGN